MEPVFDDFAIEFRISILCRWLSEKLVVTLCFHFRVEKLYNTSYMTRFAFFFFFFFAVYSVAELSPF